MTERGFLKCLLCDDNTISKCDLIQHIYQHLSYRKYQCASCTERFYSEEEREHHCIQAGHFQTHEIKLTPYCEFYVNQLLKDVEFADRHGIESVVEQRTKASLACDVALNKLSSGAGYAEIPIESSSPKQETKSLSTKKKTRKKKMKAADDERNRDATSGQLPPSVVSSKQPALNVNKAKTAKTDDGRCKKALGVTSGVHRLPVFQPQNLRRSDLEKCQLVNREMLDLIRLRMKRRFIEHLSIGKISGGAFRVSARYVEEGLCKSLDKELKTFRMVVGNLPELLNNADIDRLEFLEVAVLLAVFVNDLIDYRSAQVSIQKSMVPISDDVLSSVLSCLLDAGCRVFKVWIMGTSMASVTSSVLLRFLREPSIKGSWFSSISDCCRDNFSPEVLQFVVTRKLVLMDSFRGCFIPIYDDILAKLTAELFVIGAPNMITMNGLKSFVQRLAGGKQKVVGGRIYTNFSLSGISFPKIPNVVLTVLTGENCVQFSTEEEALLKLQLLLDMCNPHSSLFREIGFFDLCSQKR